MKLTTLNQHKKIVSDFLSPFRIRYCLDFASFFP